MALTLTRVVHNWDVVKFEGIATDSNTLRLNNLTGRISSVFAIIKPSQTCPAVSYLKHHMQKFVDINYRSSFSCYI